MKGSIIISAAEGDLGPRTAPRTWPAPSSNNTDDQPTAEARLLLHNHLLARLDAMPEPGWHVRNVNLKWPGVTVRVGPVG